MSALVVVLLFLLGLSGLLVVMARLEPPESPDEAARRSRKV